MYKTRIPIFILLCLLGTALSAQQYFSPFHNTEQSTAIAPFCQSDGLHEQQIKNNPTYRQRHQKLTEAAYRHMSQGRPAAGLRNGPYRLPVVVHIIHNGGAENLSNATAQLAIQHLNDAFANQGYYDPATGVQTNIDFCLAQRDPEDNPTNGIVRVQSSLTDFDMVTSDLELKNLSRWDPTCYINIWVVQEIRNSSIGDGVAGYATLPFSHGQDNDGIVVEATYFGSNESNSAVTVHELGHYLGLYHTFQGGCANNDCLQDGDQVCDTPPDQTTARVPCDQPSNSCNTDANSGLSTDLPDMINNYMDYSDLTCFNAFTQGQVDRMHFFLDDIRKSLTNCPSCLTPCPTPIVPEVSIVSDRIPVGDQLTFNNQTQGASLFEWYLDDSLVSTDVNLSYLFDEIGSFKVRMIATNQSKTCVSDTLLCIDVYCPVNASFTTQGEDCLSIGDQVLFVNGAAVGLTNEWYINGMLVGTDRNLNYTFNTAGTFRVQVVTSNGFCQAASTVYIVRVLCLEICDNGIDDDGDGLVDCFDDDCCAFCTDNYYASCADSCSVIVPQPSISARLERLSPKDSFYAVNNLIVGDIDQDGIVELVGTRNPSINGGFTALSESFFIYEPTENRVQDVVTVPDHSFYRVQCPLLADVDRDGRAEIFTTVTSSSRGDLGIDYFPVCLKWNGSSYESAWISDSKIQYDSNLDPDIEYGVLNLSAADFNGDGKVEIYTTNRIWDAETGELLTNGGPTNSMGLSDKRFTKSFSHAIDVLPAGFCPNCDGLELVAGNQVYAVGQQPNWSMEVVAELPNVADGHTSVVDFDADGDLDAVLLYDSPNPNFSLEVVVWDIQTPALLAPTLRMPLRGSTVFNPFFTPATMGELNGDGLPDLIFLVREDQGMTGSAMQMYAYASRGDRWEAIFDLPVNDRSAVAGCSLFDFDGDGKYEILHRGDDTFSILSGEDGSSLFSLPGQCTSATGWEYPIVVDVDNDAEAEVLIGCDSGIHIYESAGIPWPDTRNLWNQYNYFNVNVNDDLSIPIQQQAHQLPGDIRLNSFLKQFPFPAPGIPDLELTLIDVDSCQSQNILQVTLNLCNVGDAAMDSLYVTAYERDPLTGDASIVDQFVRFFRLEPAQCIEVTFAVDPAGLNGLWFVANDDGSVIRPFILDGDFPGAAQECNFGNNLTALNQIPDFTPVGILDLGPDQVVCDNGVFSFEAQDGFLSYRWQDGSTERRYTTDRPGRFWLTVLDPCGNVQSDTVRVTVDTSTVIDLGPDIVICDETDILLQADGYENYRWTPSTYLDCDTCAQVTARPTQDITYTVVGTNESGCVGVDTIAIQFRDSILIREYAQICEYDSILVFGQYVRQSGVYEQLYRTSNGCDSTYQITVDVRDSLLTEESISICPGDSVLVFGLWLSAPGTYARNYRLNSGCDSTHLVELVEYPTYLNESTETICDGDTLLLWGRPVTTSGLYRQFSLSVNGCDSVEVVDVQVVPIIEKVDSVWICEGDSYVFGMDTIRQPGRYTRELVPLGGGCDTLEVLFVNNFPPADIEAIVLPSCPGGNSGSISISPSDSSVLYSLDGQNFGPNALFEDLSAGPQTIYSLDSNGCVGENIFLVEEEASIRLQLPRDTFIEFGDYATLTASVEGAVGEVVYLWQPPDGLNCDDCPAPFLRVVEDANYILGIVDEKGCLATDTIQIGVIEPPKIFVPNVFSPNGDNINDRLTVFGGADMEEVIQLQVFNRWGALIFEQNNFAPNDPSLGWDGTFKGQLVNSGVYVYKAEIAFSFGRVVIESGDVTVLR
ncbi:MAG: M43 family zinc metalloprotease [Bacteroidota bacterium]